MQNIACEETCIRDMSTLKYASHHYLEMSSSPNKKFKLSLNRKSGSKCPESPSKRLKLTNEDDEIKTRRTKYFKIACQQVSYRDFFDYHSRYLLIYLPSCIKTACKHNDRNKGAVRCMPHYAVESFMIDVRNKTWYEALEVCRACLTPTQYLSSDVLKAVVDIILNAHEDDYSEFTVEHIINSCQEILMQNFSTHPPCLDKDLRQTYIGFLTSPMQSHRAFKKNRAKKETNNDVNIVKYCLTRLENELSADSKDEPLVDKDEIIPEDIRESVRGFHYLKKNENFESLNRQQRIERLFAVLETVIELLQFDLAIAQTRYTNDQGRVIRFEKLMDCVIQCETSTGAVTDTCRQIIRIFTCIIHLQYPESMIKTFVIWLNTLVQTFYSREIDANCDYPNIPSRYCTLFANEFYKSLSNKSQDSIIKTLEKIEPKFMRYLVGMIHVNKVLSTDEACIVTILINFLKESQWRLYPSDKTKKHIHSRSKLGPRRKAKENINTLFEEIIFAPREDKAADKVTYAKMVQETEISHTKISLSHVVHILYITLEAYLDAFDIQSVCEKWTHLNKDAVDLETVSSNHDKYSTTEYFIKKQKHMFQSMTNFIDIFSDLKSRRQLPEAMNIFENICFIKLYNPNTKIWSQCL